MSRRPTIRDIGDVLGLSTYSVSQALAGKPGVAPATRERVLQVAAEIGYVPNRVAANLKDATTKAVGVLTANGLNQYYAVLVQSIDAVLQRHGYHAVSNDAVRMQRYAPDVELAGVRDLLQQRVAAVVATYSLNQNSLKLLEKWNVPVVFVDSLPPDGAQNHPFVGIDNYSASWRVAEYLADLGHSEAVYLAYPPEWNTREPRQRGFVEAAAARRMTVQIVDADNSSDSAAVAISKLVTAPRSRWPTAIFATNTVLLQGTLKALKKAAIVIPRDVSVVGFDDFDWADLIDPPITVVDQHILDIGAAAGRRVLASINPKLLPPDDTVGVAVAEARLIVRGSCGPPRVRGV